MTGANSGLKPVHTPGPFHGFIAKGEIWKTTGRKGLLTLRLLGDIATNTDGFFDAEIIEGNAQFMSEAYRDMQADHGLGTQGTVLRFRTTLVKFMERVEPKATGGAL